MMRCCIRENVYKKAPTPLVCNYIFRNNENTCILNLSIYVLYQAIVNNSSHVKFTLTVYVENAAIKGCFHDRQGNQSNTERFS